METKVCLKCETVKIVTNFRVSFSNIDRRNNFCKECAKVHPKRELLLLGNKLCAICKHDLPRLTHFSPGKSGPHSWCKQCCSKRVSEKYANDTDWRESVKARRAQERISNADRIRETNKKPSMVEARRRGVKSFYERANQRCLTDPMFKDEFLSRRKAYKQRSVEKKITTLSDSYILSLLSADSGIKASEIRGIPSFGKIIEAKRVLLKLKRVAKEIKNTK